MPGIDYAALDLCRRLNVALPRLPARSPPRT